MNTHKKMFITLTLLILPLTYGCNHNNSSSINSQVHSNQEIKTTKNISKVESEIYSELKKNDGSFYKSILGVTLTDDVIADYNKINLLSVKIVKDINNYKIKISYDESLLTTKGLTNYLKPIYKTAYDIAEKNKIFNPNIEFYINNKSLDSF